MLALHYSMPLMSTLSNCTCLVDEFNAGVLPLGAEGEPHAAELATCHLFLCACCGCSQCRRLATCHLYLRACC